MLDSLEMCVSHDISVFQTPKARHRNKRGGELPTGVISDRVEQLRRRMAKRAPKSRMRPWECCPVSMYGQSIFDEEEVFLGGLE